MVDLAKTINEDNRHGFSEPTGATSIGASCNWYRLAFHAADVPGGLHYSMRHKGPALYVEFSV
jgi:hypothetical protein